MSIKDNLLKIKSFIWVFGIVGVVIISFGLGRLSALSQARPAVVLSMIEDIQPEQTQNTIPVGNILGATASKESEGIVVASKQGKSYHFPWCSGAKRISDENKITFLSREAAEKAGYVPAKNCKGLTDDSQ